LASPPAAVHSVVVRKPIDVARIAEALARRWVGEDALRLERLRARWPALVGHTVARRTHPARIDGATLWVHVHDEQWLHEMRWLRQPLLDRLGASEVGRGIATVEFRRGAVPTPVADPDRDGAGGTRTASPPAPPVVPLAPGAVASIEDGALRDAIHAIDDPALRERLTRLAMAAADHDGSTAR
jgi:hypothetical protein